MASWDKRTGKRKWTGKRHAHPEENLQREVAHFLDHRTDLIWYHPSPNVYRGILAVFTNPYYAKIAGAKAKQLGVKAGIPDICICTPPPAMKCSGVYIELKVGKNNLTAEQRRWFDKLEKTGYYVDVVRDSIDDLKRVLTTCGYSFS